MFAGLLYLATLFTLSLTHKLPVWTRREYFRELVVIGGIVVIIGTMIATAYVCAWWDGRRK